MINCVSTSGCEKKSTGGEILTYKPMCIFKVLTVSHSGYSDFVPVLSINPPPCFWIALDLKGRSKTVYPNQGVLVAKGVLMQLAGSLWKDCGKNCEKF